MAAVVDFLSDVRHALRQLARRPGYASLAILTLALGLGATVALGSVVRSVMLRPLPVADEGGVRVFWSDYNWRGVEFDFLASRTRAFSRLAAYSNEVSALRTPDGSRLLPTAVVSAGLLDLLGTPPLLGRTFREGEDRPGREAVVVLSYRLWQDTFDGAPDIVGRRVVLNGVPTTVIGVMPASFWFPSPEFGLWQPLNLDPASGQYQGNGWLVLLGRLRAGLSEQQVDGDVASMAAALGERFEYPAAWDKTKSPFVRPLRDYLVGDAGPALLLLLGAGALILVMACANVAALVLARAADRSHEIALRMALGAGRWRLARQLLAESVVLAITAGVTGAIIAAAGFRVLVASLPLAGGLGETVHLDWIAFALGLLLAVGVGLVVAAAPVRGLLAGELQGLGMRRGAASAGYGTGRLHGVLVGAESAVAVILVVGAALLIRSVSTLYAVELGFSPAGVTAIDLFAGSQDVDVATRTRFYPAMLERVAALPGVNGVAVTSRLPVRDGGWQGPVAIEDDPTLQGANAPNAMFRFVSPDFFRVMGIPLLHGRGIGPSDRADGMPVGVVSASFAKLAWPGKDPIGRRYQAGAFGTGAWITVVGVVDDIKVVSVIGTNPPVHYVPLAQASEPLEGGVLVVRSSGSPAPAVRALVRALEPRVAVGSITDMQDVIDRALAEPLRLRFFLTLFAALALLLGIVGVYSVVSYSVTRRRGEFGVRMALGASGSSIARQVVRRGVTPVTIGTAIGVGAVLLLGRIASRFVHGVSASDPASVAGAAAALLVAGLAAAVLPARRAARVSPMVALREE